STAIGAGSSTNAASACAPTSTTKPASISSQERNATRRKGGRFQSNKKSTSSTAAPAKNAPPNFVDCQIPSHAPTPSADAPERVSGGRQASSTANMQIRSQDKYSKLVKQPVVPPGVSVNGIPARTIAAEKPTPNERRSAAYSSTRHVRLPTR